MSAVFPTVREVLALDPVRHGAPRVVAGDAGRALGRSFVAEGPHPLEIVEGPNLRPEQMDDDVLGVERILPGAQIPLRDILYPL